MTGQQNEMCQRVSEYGTMKTTDEQSPPMDKIVCSIRLPSSLPSFQTPTHSEQCTT